MFKLNVREVIQMKVMMVMLILATHTLGLIRGIKKIPIWLNSILIGIITYVACSLIG